MTTTTRQSDAPRVLRVGWVLVALLPVTFVGGSFLGEWLLSRHGYSSGEDVPASVLFSSGLPALLLLVLPLAPAVWCGWRARRSGHPGGRALLVTALSLIVLLVVLNLVQPLAALLLGA